MASAYAAASRDIATMGGTLGSAIVMALFFLSSNT
jgi:hypothetical protein